MSNKSSSRKIYLDFSKVFSITLVCLYHSKGIILSSNAYDSSNYKVKILIDLLRVLPVVAVPLFFMVNGALLFTKKYDNIRHYKKIAEIFIIYIFWSVISFVVISMINHESISLSDIFWATYFFKHDYNNHLWFLQALVVIYLFFPILKPFFDKLENDKTLYYILLLLFVFSFADFFLNQCLDLARFISRRNFLEGRNFNFFKGIYPFGDWSYAIFYFIFGGLVENQKIYLKYYRLKAVLTFVFLLAWLMHFLYGRMKENLSGEHFDTVFPCYYTITTFAMTFIIFYFAKQCRFENKGLIKVFSIIGSRTLGIYLLHPIVNAIVKQHQHIFNVNELQSIMIFGHLLYVVIEIVFCLLVIEVMKRTSMSVAVLFHRVKN